MTKELSDVSLKANLQRLARFGANIADAHSCCIFLPTRYPEVAEATDLELAAYHSLSHSVVEDCFIPTGSGLIGWVAKHGKMVHVSPFERDARTLGIYSADQELKSFLALPLPLDNPSGDSERKSIGVIACDSKKSYAFSKLQGKLLEELSEEATHLIRLSLRSYRADKDNLSWLGFLRKGSQLIEALGTTSVEVLRLKLLNFTGLEREIGTTRSIEIVEQFFRLVQQAVPPHFPAYKMPNGDILLLLDNMMTSFFQNKIEILCKRLKHEGEPLAFEYVRSSSAERRGDRRSGDRMKTSSILEDLIAETGAKREDGDERRENYYEYRRA